MVTFQFMANGMATVVITEAAQALSAEVDAQLASGNVLSDGAALAIAAWYQSPGYIGGDFAALASGYPVYLRAVQDDALYTEREAPEDRDRARHMAAFRRWLAEAEATESNWR